MRFALAPTARERLPAVALAWELGWLAMAGDPSLTSTMLLYCTTPTMSLLKVQADLRCGCYFTRREILETYHSPHFHRLENANMRSSRSKATCCSLESKLASRIVVAVGRCESLVLGLKFPVQNDPVETGVKLLIALFVSAFTLCQPAYGDGLSSDSGCSLTGVQTTGYEYGYPTSWVRERIRGIEVLAHDPGVAELNMSITTGPIPAGVPLASAEEVGDTIIARFKNAPSLNKAELLGVDLIEEANGLRSYAVELFVDANGKNRHLLSKLIRTDRKVLSLTIQVPEELWQRNAGCMKSILTSFKAKVHD